MFYKLKVTSNALKDLSVLVGVQKHDEHGPHHERQ